MSACKFCGTDLSTISAPMGQWDHVQACELTQLRALRDRLLAYGIAGPLLDSYGEEFEAIIARAQELAK